MKNKVVSTVLLLLILGATKAQQNPATDLANRIATKMKDSLNLNENKRNQIFDINMQLHNQKTAVRQQYSNVDSIRFHVQMVENTRDSLYRTVLSQPQFQLYKEKKRTLVSNK